MNRSTELINIPFEHAEMSFRKELSVEKNSMNRVLEIKSSNKYLEPLYSPCLVFICVKFNMASKLIKAFTSLDLYEGE